MGDGFRRTQAFESDVVDQRGTRFFRQRLGHVGVDEAGRHAVHGDVAAAQLTGQCARHARHARLGGRVVRLAGVAAGTHDGRDVDDASPAGLHHAAQDRARQAEHGRQVRVQHGGPVVVLHAHGQRIAGDAGVIDEDVRAAPFLAQRVDQRIAGFGVGHVQHHTAATGRRQGFGDGGCARVGRGGAHDGCAARS
ncbi:hypothetical protein G6F58_012938 [Rhizopus delemar]|nr:hypothetical protein G6F58_012938 [Rhizopus delemar]